MKDGFFSRLITTLAMICFLPVVLFGAVFHLLVFGVRAIAEVWAGWSPLDVFRGKG